MECPIRILAKAEDINCTEHKCAWYTCPDRIPTCAIAGLASLKTIAVVYTQNSQ